MFGKHIQFCVLVFLFVVLVRLPAIAQQRREIQEYGTSLQEPTGLAAAFARMAYKTNVQQDDVSGTFHERLKFNAMLMRMRTHHAVKLRISAAQQDALREVAEKREALLKAAVSDLQKRWDQLSDEEKKFARVQLVRDDEKEAESMDLHLQEILLPRQREGLLSIFLENGGDWDAFDPIARRWLGLSAQDAARMHARQTEANDFVLRRFAELKIPIGTKLPPEDDREYRRLKAIVWSDVDESMIRRILTARSLLAEGEELVEFLKRKPYDREALEKYVPVFAKAAKEDSSTDEKKEKGKEQRRAK